MLKSCAHSQCSCTNISYIHIDRYNKRNYQFQVSQRSLMQSKICTVCCVDCVAHVGSGYILHNCNRQRQSWLKINLPRVYFNTSIMSELIISSVIIAIYLFQLFTKCIIIRLKIRKSVSSCRVSCQCHPLSIPESTVSGEIIFFHI